MDNARVIDRIQKLLRLATSANEHEAANAAARAAELMLEYQIEAADVDVTERTVEPDPMTHLATEIITQAPWKGIVAYAVAVSNGCGSVWSRQNGGRVIHFFGPATAVRTCVYVHAYLCKEIERLAKAAWTECKLENPMDSYSSGHAKSWGASFRLGAASVVGKRLRTLRADMFDRMKAAFTARGQVSKVTALVRVQEGALAVAEYGRAQFNASGKGRAVKAKAGPTGAYERGQAAGHTVALGGDHRALGSGPRALAR